ncbi:MAG: hypothetical protein KIS61_30115 [Candidatus Eremiobacteraeota bacterium]|nr:hypothetical protein [Candidatus Eremiobacteraeota bacterium]
MEEQTKRKPGRPKVYEEGLDGAPSISLRIEPTLNEHIRKQPEGARAYIERLVSDDRHFNPPPRQGSISASEAFHELATMTHSLIYWRLKLKGKKKLVSLIPHVGLKKEELEGIEAVDIGYNIHASDLWTAEKAMACLCQVERKTWMTPQRFKELFQILRLFHIAKHHYEPSS